MIENQNNKIKNKITVKQALQKAIKKVLTENKKAYLIGEEMSRNSLTKIFADKFSKQIYDTPISEAGFSGMAIGSSLVLNPIVEFMTFNFSLQAIDQIVNTGARYPFMSKNRISMNIVFRGPNGFSYGVGAQHTDCLGRLYGSFPNLMVLIPYTASDYYYCFLNVQNKGVVIFLESELLYDKEFVFTEFDNKNFIIEPYILRKGKDICLIGIGHSLELLETVSEILKKEKNIDCMILNLLLIRPLKIDKIKKIISECNWKVVIVEYSTPLYSISSEIGYQILKSNSKSAVESVCCKDISTPYAKNLEREFLPSEEKVIAAIHKVLKK